MDPLDSALILLAGLDDDPDIAAAIYDLAERQGLDPASATIDRPCNLALTPVQQEVLFGFGNAYDFDLPVQIYRDRGALQWEA